jgi:hypothetical protein
MSTPFFFVTVFGFIGLLAVIFAFVRSMRNDRLEAEARVAEAKAEAAYHAANPVRLTPDDIQRVHGERVAARQAVNHQPMGSGVISTPVYQGYSPAVAAPVYHSDPLTGLATGMLIGSAIGNSHGHGASTTIINEAPSSHSHSYSDSGSSSSYSSSSSSDSGFSYSDSSSSSSDSGGFDASW